MKMQKPKLKKETTEYLSAKEIKKFIKCKYKRQEDENEFWKCMFSMTNQQEDSFLELNNEENLIDYNYAKFLYKEFKHYADKDGFVRIRNDL